MLSAAKLLLRVSPPNLVAKGRQRLNLHVVVMCRRLSLRHLLQGVTPRVKITHCSRPEISEFVNLFANLTTAFLVLYDVTASTRVLLVQTWRYEDG